MKKLITSTLAILIIASSICHAEDLSGYTFDELISLQKAIVAEIMSRPEWKEVEVPAGYWTVGEDIPAGVYSIAPKDLSLVFKVYPSKGDTNFDMYSLFTGEYIGKIEFLDGMLIENSKAVIFSPAKTLGF